MAHRRIGQEQLKIGDNKQRSSSLDEIAGLIDWTEVDRHLAGIYAATKGEPAWPPLALFKALLLAAWYELSDIKLAEAMEDRTSFRRFCQRTHPRAHGVRQVPQCVGGAWLGLSKDWGEDVVAI